MDNDPKGYYARLGVKSSAGAAEIKAAYRSLAKQHHPDLAGGSVSSEAFRACTEAYEVLSDPKRRADYDALAYDHAGEAAEPLDFVHCSKCKRVTAQPRHAVFRYVVSVLITTITTPVQGIFCADCAKRIALRSSTITGLFGWWGVPWGPILTIKEIIRNGTGGERRPDLDDRLSLYTAFAFASRENLRLAHAIACRLIKSSDPHVSRDSARLVDELERLGVAQDNPSLKDTWTKPNRFWIGHAAAALTVPMIAIISLNAMSAPTPSYTNAFDVGSMRSENGETSGSAGPFVPEPLAAPITCADPPDNGYVFERRPSSSGGHVLTIKNGGSGDAIVKVRDAASREVVASFFVTRDQTASLSDLPDGAYRFMYATGDALNESCDGFISPNSVNEFPHSETFVTRETATHVVSQSLEYTLYEVLGGNVSPRSIDIAAFDAP